MKHALPTRLLTGLLILLMGLFPLAQSGVATRSPRPEVVPASVEDPPAVSPSPTRFCFGSGVPPMATSPAEIPPTRWAIPPSLPFRSQAPDGGQAPDSTAPTPAMPSKAKSNPHVSWFETREGKITSGLIIAGIIVGAVVYAACQGNVVIVNDGGLLVETKRK